MHAFFWSLKKKKWLLEEGTEVWPFHDSVSVCSCCFALSHICYVLRSMGPVATFCFKWRSVKLQSYQCFPAQKPNHSLQEPLCDSLALYHPSEQLIRSKIQQLAGKCRRKGFRYSGFQTIVRNNYNLKLVWHSVEWIPSPKPNSPTHDCLRLMVYLPLLWKKDF